MAIPHIPYAVVVDEIEKPGAVKAEFFIPYIGQRQWALLPGDHEFVISEIVIESVHPEHDTVIIRRVHSNATDTLSGQFLAACIEAT